MHNRLISDMSRYYYYDTFKVEYIVGKTSLSWRKFDRVTELQGIIDLTPIAGAKILTDEY